LNEKQMAKENNRIPTIFLLCLDASSPVGTDPIFNLSLLIDPMRHTLTGIVDMRQKSQPYQVRFDVTGTFYEMLFGPEIIYIITLKGEYAIPLPPPQVGEI